MAAAPELSSRRRATRVGARGAAGGKARIRVPARELVRGRRLRAAARTGCRSCRGGRSPGANCVVALRAPPSRCARTPRELQRVGAAGMGGSHPALGRRCLRVLQQRLGSLCSPQRAPSRAAGRSYTPLSIARRNPSTTTVRKPTATTTTEFAAEKLMTPIAAPLLVQPHYGDARGDA